MSNVGRFILIGFITLVIIFSLAYLIYSRRQRRNGRR